MKTVEQYWRKHEWAKPHELNLDNCPIDTNVGGDCKELIDATDFILQSFDTFGEPSHVTRRGLIKDVKHVMEVWYFG